ncbi:MAG TPA: gluconate 2-dehydrogenase subunit 3 family protein [Puia sp.]
MSINRRTAIRQLAFISAGAALLPSCFHEQTDEGVSFNHFKVNDDEQQLLEKLTATLIPTSDTPGAKEVSADRFVWKMLDDCATADDRSKFLNGLQQFDAAAKARGGKSFVKLEPAGREALLSAIEAKKLPDEELNFFYTTTKRLTILAYSSSQYFLTKVQVYELVPGRWSGCVPVKMQSRKAS